MLLLMCCSSCHGSCKRISCVGRSHPASTAASSRYDRLQMLRKLSALSWCTLGMRWLHVMLSCSSCKLAGRSRRSKPGTLSCSTASCAPEHACSSVCSARLAGSSAHMLRRCSWGARGISALHSAANAVDADADGGTADLAGAALLLLLLLWR
jgi:hypothetical protein